LKSQICFTPDELNVVVEILSNDKRRAILKALKNNPTKNPLYFNELFEVVRANVKGSKSTIANELEELESEGVLKSDLIIRDIGAKVNPIRAVRIFEIDQKYKNLLDKISELL